MRALVCFLLLAFFVTSCENTEEPKVYYKMIGAINFELLRMQESGRVLGEFLCGYYLSGIKVELLSGGKVVETTYTKADTSSDRFYLLEKIELGKIYKVRITLNDEMVDSSEIFTVQENDIIEFPNDSASKAVFDNISWFKKGKYYIDMVWKTIDNATFDLYTDTEQFIIYPNPVLDYGQNEFSINQSGLVKIDLINIKKETLKIILSDTLSAGTYKHQINGDSIADGLYILRLMKQGQTLYCPFLKGRKGAPPAP